MRDDIEKHRRRCLRLAHYDYSRPGAYFVTLCAQDRRCLFGEIVDEDMEINGAGRMIREWFAELENKFPAVHIIESVVMPNHTHAILCIAEDVGAAPTQGRPYIRRHGRLVQDNDNQCIHSRDKRMRLAPVPRQTMAAELLRTHNPQRGRPPKNSRIHPLESGKMGAGQ